jgi:hypothetical protein
MTGCDVNLYSCAMLCPLHRPHRSPLADRTVPSARVLFAITLGLVLSSCAHIPITSPAVADPGWVSVVEWGGQPLDASLRARARTHVPTRLTLHHAGVPFGPERDPVAHLRQLQRWSREMRGWADIPYHYVIDRAGVVYEAREIGLAGDTNTQYDPAGHALVMVLGNFEETQPTPAQRAAVVRTFATLARRHQIDVNTLAGHRDLASDTVCPGRHLAAWLESGELKTEIAQAMRARSPQ